MHDIRVIRADPAAFDTAMARRGIANASIEVLRTDQQLRSEQARIQQFQTERNAIAKLIGNLKRSGADSEAEEDVAQHLRMQVFEADAEAKAIEETLRRYASSLPNILDAGVPDGADESANVVLHTQGTPAAFDFAPKQHFELGEALGLMDFAAAARLSGARFTVLSADLARLERALGQWMLDLHTVEHGYTETSPPLLVNEAAVYGTGQLPKFADDLFRTTDDRFLIPTAEVPLTNLVREQILAEADLPRRFTALTPCFRSEAGSAGRDTRGMLRQHQFQKVELVSVTRPEDSDAEHERMTRCAERVLTELGLVWRRVLLCAGDTGFSAAKTYDLEVWLPGQGAWREISSCSNCRSFQARRMAARYRPAGQKGTEFVHTLNGSGVAVGRALIAVMETHQQADGGIALPPPLRPWFAGRERIGPG